MISAASIILGGYFAVISFGILAYRVFSGKSESTGASDRVFTRLAVINGLWSIAFLFIVLYAITYLI